MSRETKQPEPLALSDQQLALHRWRYRQARRAGLPWFDAKFFADSKLDIEEMRWLARNGYPPEQILDFLKE